MNQAPTPDDDALDQAWWDRLAGRTHAGPHAPQTADLPELQRADQLRAALLAMDQDMQDEQAARSTEQANALPHQHQRLRFEQKARAGSASKGDRSAWSAWRTWGSVAVAASLLMVLVLPHRPQDETLEDGFTLRGDEAVQVITDAQPRVRAQTLASQLRSRDMVVRVHQGKTIAVLEIEVPPEDFAALKPVLEEAGITARPGQLLVRIQAP
jgi:hypothetical protein